MTLPPDFIFSQNNLQDFVDCPRRFQLKFILHTTWPAPVSEPMEEHERLMRLGSDFHRMVHQFYLKIPEEKISQHIDDPDLNTWWEGFLANPPSELPEIRKPEIYLSMPFEGYRLAAKIDLLAIEKGKQVVIVDWKTTHRKPHPQGLMNKIQSLVYPYVVYHAGKQLNDGKTFSLDQIRMVYWFPAFPDKAAQFFLDETWLKNTESQLIRLVREISGMNLEIFPLTSETAKCKFCRYRSLCDRGVTAGQFDEDENDTLEESETLLNINFDEIQGIAF